MFTETRWGGNSLRCCSQDCREKTLAWPDLSYRTPTRSPCCRHTFGVDRQQVSGRWHLLLTLPLLPRPHSQLAGAPQGLPRPVEALPLASTCLGWMTLHSS